MNEIDFSAFLVSRVCHDLVGPLGAVVNGLEVLEDERDAMMRAEALKIVSSSAEQALARLQFMRIAFGAAGSAGAELDLGEVGRLVQGLVAGTKTEIRWNAAPVHWPKDWAKLLMNAAVVVADCLPRGGVVTVQTGGDAAAPSFRVEGTGTHIRVSEEMEKAVRGEASTAVDARGIQPFLAHKLARALNAGLTLTAHEGGVAIAAG
ncbi:MAG TPA: histidine phosphotransferase family protein [Rhizomicrobium sp.]|jgi:histidine phosphotransferase ChpT